MLTLTQPTDLEKAGKHLGVFFAKEYSNLEKSHTFHAAMAAHHAALHKAHAAQAAHNQAVHDGLDNSHELKHHFAKTAAYHTESANAHDAMSKAHAAHAETMKADMDAIKTLTSEFGGTAAKADGSFDVASLAKGEGLDARIAAVSEAMMTKALESLNNDPKIISAIQGIVLGQIEKAVGGKLAPTEVSAIAPPATAKAVTRNGQPAITDKKAPDVPLEFEHLIKMDMSDELSPVS